MPVASEPRTRRVLGAPETRRFLHDYIRKRVGESDVDDVVQTVLVEALASDRVPEDETEMRKWLIGVARHKIADHHRRGGREQPAELPDIETAPAPVEERELARWAEEQAHSNKDAQKTLQWMAREGEGDKLEHIAEEEQLPAARVRQRVSRMRRFMKERWLAELAAVAAVALVAIVLWRVLREPDVDIARDQPGPDPTTEPSTRPPPIAPRVAEAGELRKKALQDCDQSRWQPCLEALDKAKELDPAGDTAPAVQEARKKADDALRIQPQNELDNNGDKDSIQEKAPAKPEPSSTPPAPTFAPPKPPAPTKEDFGKKPAPKAPNKAPPSDFDKKSSSFDGSNSTGDALAEVIAPPMQQAPVASQPAPQFFPPQAAFPPTSSSFSSTPSTKSSSLGKPTGQRKSAKKSKK